MHRTEVGIHPDNPAHGTRVVGMNPDLQNPADMPGLSG